MAHIQWKGNLTVNKRLKGANNDRKWWVRGRELLLLSLTIRNLLTGNIKLWTNCYEKRCSPYQNRIECWFPNNDELQPAQDPNAPSEVNENWDEWRIWQSWHTQIYSFFCNIFLVNATLKSMQRKAHTAFNWLTAKHEWRDFTLTRLSYTCDLVCDVCCWKMASLSLHREHPPPPTYLPISNPFSFGLEFFPFLHQINGREM